MVATFLLIYASTGIISVCWSLAWFVLASAMMCKQVKRKRYISFCICFCIIQIAYNHIAMYISELPPMRLINIGIFTLHGIILALFLYEKEDGGVICALSTSALSYFFISNFFYVVQIIFLNPLEAAMASPSKAVRIGVLIILHIASLLFSLGMTYFFRRFKFYKYWKNLFDSKLSKAALLLVSVMLMHSYTIITLLYPQWEESTMHSLVTFALMFATILVLCFLSVFETNRHRLAWQEAQIRQQQAYVQVLERLQSDVRSFRHDYQNMLTGMYLQAQEGDVAGVQKQLQQKLQYFDDNLADEVRQITCLSNLVIPEVKSLVALKLMQLQEKAIRLTLEIPKPVSHLALETEDFIRIMGVLFDNAMEAAAKAEVKNMIVMLLEDEGVLSVVIKNTFPADAEPEVNRVWEEGYTTKGDFRGTGLAGIRRIMDKYDEMIANTMVEDGMFAQKILIDLGGAG